MRAKLSTPSEYLQAVNSVKSQKYPVNNHDFFPYADMPNAYWTGYFTTRPAHKGFIKSAGRYL